MWDAAGRVASPRRPRAGQAHAPGMNVILFGHVHRFGGLNVIKADKKITFTGWGRAGAHAETRRTRKRAENSAPTGARTLDPRIKSPLLYQLSYRRNVASVTEGARPRANWRQSWAPGSRAA